MKIGVDVQAGLFYYHLSLVKREDNLYCLVDLQTGEWYEKMTIYYIQKLLLEWNSKRNDAIMHL